MCLKGTRKAERQDKLERSAARSGLSGGLTAGQASTSPTATTRPSAGWSSPGSTARPATPALTHAKGEWVAAA